MITKFQQSVWKVLVYLVQVIFGLFVLGLLGVIIVGVVIGLLLVLFLYPFHSLSLTTILLLLWLSGSFKN